MEKEAFYGNPHALSWRPPVAPAAPEMSCAAPDQLPFLLNSWERSVAGDELRASSPVSNPSPATGSADSLVISELIGRLGGICSSGETPSPPQFNPNAANSKKRKSKGKQQISNSAFEKVGDAKGCKPEKTLEGDKETNPPEPAKDYIHVRARRGQATDSHSLAERVRREKISERMKFLQDLVPGCNKVTGKALMLDEIINYVQSLQQQVEFLSMKLATVSPNCLDMENFTPKDFHQARVPTHHSFYPNLDISPNSFSFDSQTRNGHPAETNHGFIFASSALRPFFEDDLHGVVHMGSNSSSQSFFQGTMDTSHMKIEL